ncbi:MAG: hypothetical protein ACJZ4D_01535 [Candidatus Poseidoniales archaeon]
MNRKPAGRPPTLDKEGNVLNLSPTMINLPEKLKGDLYDIGVNRSQLVRDLLQDWVDQYYGLENKSSVERNVSRARQSDFLKEKEELRNKLDEARREHYDLLKGLSNLMDGQPVYGPDW